MNMENKKSTPLFFWQIISAHTVSYTIAGVIALYLFNYRALWEMEAMSVFYRAIDTPIVALGPFLQIFRGIIVALILLPLRKTFFEEKHGLLKLGLVILGFSIISTYGAVIASFEGLIYLDLPLSVHLWGIPEGLIWLSLFIGILKVMIDYSHRRVVLISSVIAVLLICLLSTFGFLAALATGGLL